MKANVSGHWIVSVIHIRREKPKPSRKGSFKGITDRFITVRCLHDILHSVREKRSRIFRSIFNRTNNCREPVFSLVSLNKIDKTSNLVIREARTPLIVEIGKLLQRRLIAEVITQVLIGFVIKGIEQLISSFIRLAKIFDNILMKIKTRVFYDHFSYVMIKKFCRILGALKVRHRI